MFHGCINFIELFITHASSPIWWSNFVRVSPEISRDYNMTILIVTKFYRYLGRCLSEGFIQCAIWLNVYLTTYCSKMIVRRDESFLSVFHLK